MPPILVALFPRVRPRLPAGALAAVLAVLCATPGRAAAAPDAPAIRLADVSRGSLLIAEADGSYREAPTQNSEVAIHVTGPIARAVVRQRFRNPGDGWAEAVYAFPLPDDAAVDRLRLRIGERVVEGEIHERAQARQVFDRAREQGQRAALVEQHRPDLFTTAVTNLPPNGEVIVEIEYQQAVAWRDGAFSLRFPLAITPRYTPAAATLDETLAIGGGWAVLPGELDNAVPQARVDGAPADPDSGRVALSVTLAAGLPLAAIDSRHHPVVRDDADGVVHLRLAEATVLADRDFELVWTPQPQRQPRAAFFTQTTEHGDFGLLMLMPPDEAFSQGPPLSRETLFVIDTSGSMSGQSLRAAQAALESALLRLGPGDSFNVIEFNSHARALFRAPVAGDRSTVERAVSFVRALQADGGTEMHAALALAFAQPQHVGRLRQIVFITDGAVGNEAALFELIDTRLGQARLFTVGIGSAPNHHFMNEAARVGRGSATTIAAVDDVQREMDALFARLERPALTDIRVTLPGAHEQLPDPIPDLYVGEPLSVVMRLSQPVTQATLEGQVGATRWRSDVSLRGGETQHGLDVLWARRRIAHLERQGLRGLAPDAIREQALAVALRHHLVSRYTSLVAVDRSPARPPEAELDAHALPANLPAGWVAPDRQLAFAQTGTASRAALLLGAVLVLLAAGLRARGVVAGRLA